MTAPEVEQVKSIIRKYRLRVRCSVCGCSHNSPETQAACHRAHAGEPLKGIVLPDHLRGRTMRLKYKPEA